MRTRRPRNGLVLYEGPSMLDGQPVVAIATGIYEPSRNRKTGFMIQTWILHATLSPLEALSVGADRAICGDCSLRGSGQKDRICYVTLFDAPMAVWRHYRAGKYDRLCSFDWLKYRAIRFGSYGDPAAVPFDIWGTLATHALRFTGYTHEWREQRFQAFRHLMMASVETPTDAIEAHALGWRTYRMRLSHEPLLPFELACPASNEMLWSSSCFACGGCNGRKDNDARRGYAIIAHGVGRYAYARRRAALA